MQKLWFIIGLFLANCTFANIGEVALNATEPLQNVAGFVAVGSLLVAIFCFFAAIIRYFSYRSNPLAVPFGKVMWLVIMGLLLLILPFSYMLTGNGMDLLSLWGS